MLTFFLIQNNFNCLLCLAARRGT